MEAAERESKSVLKTFRKRQSLNRTFLSLPKRIFSQITSKVPPPGAKTQAVF